jgi:hypothetical protein
MLTIDDAVERAKSDLAASLGIEADEILIIEKEEAMWPDTSLGMPEPGMAYAQMLTCGFRVVLEAKGKRYEYHFAENMVKKRMA